MTYFGGEFPDQVSVPISADETGMTGRECPDQDCLGYFKIQFGTGLKGKDLPCYCPYCGNIGSHDTFWTKEQLDYAKSIAVREISELFVQELKKSEFDIPARGAFGIGMSLKVEAGPPLPIRYYREKRLETEVVCNECTLRFAIYGVFAYCPDCGTHNSQQILSKNLDLAMKELDLASKVDTDDMKEILVNDALENVVSAFDGFGRELCRLHASQTANPKDAEKLSFQNLTGADGRVQQSFGFHLSLMVESSEWDLAIRCFNKRHLLAHRMGVVDHKYKDATNDDSAVVGRKVRVNPNEIRELASVVCRLGDKMTKAIGCKTK